MKKLFLFFVLFTTAHAVIGQTIGGTERVRVIDGDTIWMPTVDQLAAYIGSVNSTGTVTSVDIAVPTGLTATGGPITTAGVININNNMAAGFVKSQGVGSGFITVDSIDLSTFVTGVLDVPHGGTGNSSFPANEILIGNGTGPIGTIPLGGANTLLGMNAAGTANEYKTVNVGTAGTDFNISNAAGSITFNLPDASPTARGAVNTVAQSFGGRKTFTEGSIHDGSATVSAIEMNGALKAPLATVTTTATLNGTNYNVALNPTSGGFVVNLPAAATASGWVYAFAIVADGGTVTIAPNGAETFSDGSAAKFLTGKNAFLKIQSNGTSWVVLQ